MLLAGLLPRCMRTPERGRDGVLLRDPGPLDIGRTDCVLVGRCGRGSLSSSSS